jgi:hypothetical protein
MPLQLSFGMFMSIFQIHEIGSHCNKTYVMHFLFDLLRINTFTCYEKYLLILRRRRTSETWYFNPGAANWQHARSIPSAACLSPPEDEQVMLETCRGINS